MEDSEKPPGAPASRGTLKLKSPVTRTTATRTAPSAPPPAAPRPQTRHQEPSSWADEHKHRMQADMDALSVGHTPPNTRQRKR